MSRITLTVDAETIEVPDRFVPLLQREVDRSNLNPELPQPLSLAEWLLLHLQEVAVQSDLALAIDRIRKQHEADANAALDAALRKERERLLGEPAPKGRV